MTTISYLDFKKYILEIRNSMDAQLAIQNALSVHGGSFVFPTLVDQVIELLETVMDDEDDLIGQWIFEWNFGKDAKNQGYDIVTIRDLWIELNKKSLKNNNIEKPL